MSMEGVLVLVYALNTLCTDSCQVTHKATPSWTVVTTERERALGTNRTVSTYCQSLQTVGCKMINTTYTPKHHAYRNQ